MNTGHAPQRDPCIQVCFGAKESQGRCTMLSERAVLIRVHRINAATSERSAGTKTNCPNDAAEQAQDVRIVRKNEAKPEVENAA